MSEYLPPIEQKAASKPGVMSLGIKERSALYASYMPFLKSGGLFIPTSKPYKVGEEVFLLLSLLDDPEKLKVAGQVVWINPFTHGNRPQGIGVQFNENQGGAEARNKIEGLLATALKSTRQTYTM